MGINIGKGPGACCLNIANHRWHFLQGKKDYLGSSSQMPVWFVFAFSSLVKDFLGTIKAGKIYLTSSKTEMELKHKARCNECESQFLKTARDIIAGGSECNFYYWVVFSFGFALVFCWFVRKCVYLFGTG